MRRIPFQTSLFTLLLTTSTAFAAHDKHPETPVHASTQATHDHHHLVGDWMVSYRYMSMSMEGLRRGTDGITPDMVATQVANPNPGPVTVRVVPLEMQSDMHMLGAMYALSDRITLMGMVNYLKKDMELTTYQGMMGSDVLGTFGTASEGVGDTKASVLWGIHEDPVHKVHASFGVSIPTGSIKDEGAVLTPMGMRSVMRLPYGMQLGSGSWNFEPGLIYSGYRNKLGWGADWHAAVRFEDNSEGYRLGDRHHLSAWGSVSPRSWLTGLARLSYVHEDAIEGKDELITAPVTTADPANYGGERVNLGLSLAFTGQTGFLHGHRLELLYELPLQQDVNGVQLEMEPMMGMSYQYSF